MAKYVQYVGTSNIRRISRQDWEVVGVHNQDTVQWDRTNAFLVPLKSISDDAFPFIEADAELIVVDRLARNKADMPDDASMGPEKTTGYLETLRTEDEADTSEVVVLVPADQTTGSADAKAGK